jgi:hypothetical protein
MLHKKGAGGLAQGVGPEFKPQKKKKCALQIIKPLKNIIYS